MKSTEDKSAIEVLQLFANYGFRKASMGDIASAAGLSRQSIYNQYGSKEAALDWAVNTFLGDLTNAVVELLKTADGTPTEVLARVFQTKVGDHLHIVRGTPHGAEILDAAKETAAKSARDYEGEISDAIVSYLLRSGTYKSEEAARDAEFVLSIAAKGLLFDCDASAEFNHEMMRVIDVVIGSQPTV